MVHEQISRDELVQFYRAGLVMYEMSESVIERYVFGIRHLHSYMESENIDRYDLEVGIKFRKWTEEATQFSLHVKRRDIRSINLLDRLMLGEPYEHMRSTARHELPGEMGSVIRTFIGNMQDTKHISKSTKVHYLVILDRFAVYADMHGISPKELSMTELMQFLSSTQNCTASVLGIMRRFLGYMHEEHITGTDLSLPLTGIRPKRHEKVPSYYDRNEIMRIEGAVDRASALGKRDYAIILLASRLGLRSSDISRLMFSNLDWDANRINIVQYKTKKPLTLPLLSDVGNAIIDYVRYGRPKTALNNIFVTANKPYGQISPMGMYSIVSRHIYRAGILPKGRHMGCHCLRHSLATTLLENETALPVISECLGHTSTASTMYYLGIDVKSLLECSLEVPPVEEAFYNQKGGMLYE